VALVATGAVAASKPIQLSLTPDIALYGRSEQISGLTLNIWGEEPADGAGLGVGQRINREQHGRESGHPELRGQLQGPAMGFVNYTKQDFSGWQGGPFFGLLVSAVNYTGGTMTGSSAAW